MNLPAQIIPLVTTTPYSAVESLHTPIPWTTAKRSRSQEL